MYGNALTTQHLIEMKIVRKTRKKHFEIIIRGENANWNVTEWVVILDII